MQAASAYVTDEGETMQRITVEGGYPVWIEEIAKADTPWRDVDEIIAALRERIQRHAGFAYIGVLDHYGLILRLGETHPAEMRDAKAILFCPGAKRLNPVLPALCPGAISVADMGNRFVIFFLDAPAFLPAQTLARWVADLRGKEAQDR